MQAKEKTRGREATIPIIVSKCNNQSEKSTKMTCRTMEAYIVRRMKRIIKILNMKAGKKT